MSGHANMLHGAVGHFQPVLKIKILAVARCLLDLLLHHFAVLRVNPGERKSQRRLRTRIALKDSEGLVRPENLSARNLPSEASGVAESLGFGQVGFAPSELLGQEFVLSNIDGAPDALLEALAVNKRDTDASNVTDLAIGSHNALGGVEGHRLRHEPVDQVGHRFEVPWVDETQIFLNTRRLARRIETVHSK